MDALSDMLRVVGLTGGIFLDARFTAPWCVAGQVGPESCAPYMTPPDQIVCFHFVVEGKCFIETSEGVSEVEEGEAVLLPRNQLHRLGSVASICVKRLSAYFRAWVSSVWGKGI